MGRYKQLNVQVHKEQYEDIVNTLPFCNEPTIAEFVRNAINDKIAKELSNFIMKEATTKKGKMILHNLHERLHIFQEKFKNIKFDKVNEIITWIEWDEEEKKE